MATKNRGFRSLIGGALGDLDYFPVAGISDNDASFGIVGDLHHSYFYNASLVIAANNSPYQIIPADNATGTGAWVLSGYQGAFSHVRAKSSAGMTVQNAVETTIVYETEGRDTLKEYDHTTGIFTALYTGDYVLSMGFAYASAAWSDTEVNFIRVMINSSEEVKEISAIPKTNTYIYGKNLSAGVYLTAGDTLYTTLRHNQGGSLTLNTDSAYNVLSIDRIA